MGFEANEEKKNLATQLVEMVAHYEIFHDDFNKGYIALTQSGHIENWPLDGDMFKSWLAHQYYEDNKIVPSKSALGDAVSTLRGQAQFKGAQCTVYNRVAK